MMTKSKVYFASLRSKKETESRQNQVKKLFDAAGFGALVREGDLAAVKVHFGEQGNDTYLNPLFVHQVVEKIQERGGRPFVTDTNTLYGLFRANAVDHLRTAQDHGFLQAVLGAPVIIADGLRGQNLVQVPIKGKHFREVKIAGDIHRADSMMVLSHFKGHILAGFGGAIKNLGMGCASPFGKAEQHCAKPIVIQDRCQGCGRCVEVCPQGAVELVGGKVRFDRELCQGCGQCLRYCPNKALDLDWMVAVPPFLERMAEYALGALQKKENHTGFMNFLLNVTPDCDCLPWSDSPIVPDVGLLASRDPVALDQASLDLVNAQHGLPGSRLKSNYAPGQDKFQGLWAHTDGRHLLAYAQEIGLGSQEYDLVEI